MTVLTIEDELDLIKRRGPAAAPAPVLEIGDNWTRVAKPKTPEEIDADLGLPPAETGLGPTPANDAGTWDILGAAWRAETIRTDAWNDTAARRRALSEEMWGLLDQDGRQRLSKEWERYGWNTREALITAEAARQAAISPDAARIWGGYPLSIDDFNRRIDAGRLADLNEAQAVLDQPGGGFATFLGSAARAMTDETSLMLMPFGISGSAWRTIAGEAALGGLGEAAVLPKEYRVAEELGLPDPDPMSRIGLGILAGGGLAAGILGLGRGVTALRARVSARRASLDETLPPGVDRIHHEADVEAAEGALRGDQTVQERLGGGEAQSARAASRNKRQQSAAEAVTFDYAAGGGADPATNLVGYTVGKLIDRGMEPHIAMGFVANFMAESGRGLNTGAIGDGGMAYGIAQWNGRRRDKLIEYAEGRGKNWRDIDVQIDFLFHEIGGAQAGAFARIRSAGTADEAARLVSNLFERPGIPHLGTRVAYARMLSAQYREGKVPKAGDPGQWHTGDEGSSRGYTGAGQIAVGDDMRIDVDYEVVDYSTLIRASGDLQPRDRSRIASDDWIAATAARLDPALLMPSPSAATGTPIVGPDNIIESGNGRAMAIGRAFDLHPDRASAYRGMIEAEGFAIPEGVRQPVLIARRRTELDRDQRRRLVIDAQDSGVAQMTATDTARSTAQGLTAPVLARLDPLQPLTAEANGGFVRAALATLSRSARNAMFGPGGALNAPGQRALREALFARAWPDPDILARYTEGGPSELKSLMEALETSAPAWAALKADIEAGRVAPEMDIGGFVLDAMRLIAAAREVAVREGLPIAKAVAELLDEIDLLTGAVSPLTTALVRKFWRNGRAAPADRIAGLLTRYADEARKAGATGAMFDAPGPADVLRRIDPEAFGDLPGDLGTARGFATRSTSEAPPEAVADLPGEDFDQGAMSPEAEAVHAGIVAELRGGTAGAAEDGLDALLASGATYDQIAAHPRVAAAVEDMGSRVPTTELPGYGTDAFWQSRVYRDGATELQGRTAAVEHLLGRARGLAWAEDGLTVPADAIRRNQQAVLLIGAPAAGKSTVANPLARARGAMVLDADEAKKLIPEFDSGPGANAVHEESSELAAEAVARAVAAGENIVLPKVGSDAGSMERQIRALQARGYRVDLVLVDVPRDVALRRMIGRFNATGRIIPLPILERGVDGAKATYQMLKSKDFIHAHSQIDNTPGLGQPRRIVEDPGKILPAELGRDGADRGGRPGEGAGPARQTEGLRPAPPVRPAGGALAAALATPEGITTFAERLTKADRKWLRDAYGAGLLERRPSGLGSHTLYRFPVAGSDARWERAEIAPSASPAGRAAASDDAPATFMAEPASAPPAPSPARDGDIAPIDMAALAQDQIARDLARARDELGAFAEVEIDLPDGTRARAGEFLDELDLDRAADEAINTCLLNPAGAFIGGATA